MCKKITTHVHAFIQKSFWQKYLRSKFFVLFSVKKEVEKYAILQGRTGGTSQQQHRMSARKVSNNLLNFEAKVNQYSLN